MRVDIFIEGNSTMITIKHHIYSVIGVFILILCTQVGCVSESRTEDEPPKISSAKGSESEKRNNLGIFLGEKYEGDRIRYIFHKDSVDIYIQVTGYVLRCGGRDLYVSRYSTEDDKTVSMVIDDKYDTDLPTSIGRSPYGESKKYKKSDIDTIAIAQEGDYYCILKNAPITLLETTLTVDWSACKPATVCQEYGANSDDEVFKVDSDGLILIHVTNPSFKLQRKKWLD
jgi:hypothetical protein